MKKAIIAIATLLFVSSSVWAAKYNVDTAHSSVSFEVTHLMISTVVGKFKSYIGTADFDPKKGVLKNVKVTIQANSIDTGIAKRDGHLKSPDFFNAGKFSTLTFVSTKPAKRIRKGRKFSLRGKLTIKGVTRKVVLKGTYRGTAKSPFTGATKAAFVAHTTINREKFGLKWNKAIEGGGVLVGKKIKILIKIEAAPAK